MRPHKVPRHPGLPGEEHRGFPAPLPLSPFYPCSPHPVLKRRSGGLQASGTDGLRCLSTSCQELHSFSEYDLPRPAPAWATCPDNGEMTDTPRRVLACCPWPPSSSHTLGRLASSTPLRWQSPAGAGGLPPANAQSWRGRAFHPGG